MNDIVRQNVSFIASQYSEGQASLVRQASLMVPSVVDESELDTALPYSDTKIPRLVVFCGLPGLKFLSDYCKSKFVRETVKGIIIIENNPQKVCNLLNDRRFIQFLSSPIMRFILCPGMENVKPLFFNVLKEPEFSRIMQSAMCFPYEHESVTAADKEVYEHIANTYEETMFHVFHNYGRIDDSLEGVKATLLNVKNLLSKEGIKSLKDKAKGLTAVIVGAGPSLDKDIEILAKNKDKFIIIAVDAAVKPLLKHGIEPHFATSIERGNIYQKPFWEGLPPINTQLVYFPVVHPEVLSLFPGPLRPVYRNYTYFGYFEYSWPKGMMHSGGSTSHLANRLAVHLSCKEIVYIALDNSYEKHPTEDSYRSHCNSLGYEEWAGFHPIEYFNKEKNHAPAYQVTAFDGSAVMTNITYHQWAKEFAEEIIVLGLAGKVYHTNPKAVAIPGVTYAPLLSIVDSLESIVNYPDFKGTGTVDQYRIWDNKHLINSFEGWLQYAKTVIKWCDEGQELKLEGLEAKCLIATIHDFLDQKFTKDNLFIAFIVQNCAAEYYESTNAWYALPNDLSEKVSERLQVLKDRVMLYETVLTKLLKVFKESGL